MFVFSKENEISTILINKINNSKEILISVAFITSGGVKYLLKSSNLKDKNIKIITTTENFITDYEVLSYFLKNNIETKIINKNDEQNNKSMHNKFIIFDKKEAINGSLNLTYNALNNKYEAINIETDNINDYLDSFNYLWEKGTKLSEKFLDEYNEQYKIHCFLHNQFRQDLKDKLNVKPNKMQEDVLNEIYNLRQRGKNIALLWAATGTGKTYLSAFDAKRYNFKKLLFIVHNRTIIKSARRDFENIFYGKKTTLELFSNDYLFVDKSNIVFSTEKTIKNIIDKNPYFLNQFDYFIFDEAHKIGPSSSSKNDNKNYQSWILEKVKKLNNIFILGMTATPQRTDDYKYLLNSFDENVIGKVDTERAIKEGLISTFKYYGTDVNIDFEKEDLSSVDLNELIDKFINTLTSKKTWNEKKIKGIIFVKNIKESDKAAEILTKKGFLSKAIHSKINDSKKVASNVIDELQNESSKLNFIVTIDMFNEGIDIPNLNTIAMLRFTDSNIIYTQQIGRGLRKMVDEKTKKEKYLNIFDMVGNHENNFERMISLTGKNIINPKELLSRIITKELIKFGNYNKVEITPVAQEKILRSLAKMKYYDFFTRKIREESFLYKNDVNLLNIEEILQEDIGIISNNFRQGKIFLKGNKSWLSLALKENNFVNIDEMSDLEHQLIELFSWMPFTVSTPTEKQLILNLLNGETIKIDQKWVSYFCGKNLNGQSTRQEGNSRSQIVEGDFREYFVVDQNQNKLTFKFNFAKSNSYKYLINQIEKYLIENKDRNDKLKYDKWYSKMEIAFIAGYTARVNSGRFKKYKYETSFNESEIFLTNKIDKTDETGYKNEVNGVNKFTISSNQVISEMNDEIIHNFIGIKKFNKDFLYKYIGTPKKIKFIDKKARMPYYSETINKDLKEYNRYQIESQFDMNNLDYAYFIY